MNYRTGTDDDVQRRRNLSALNKRHNSVDDTSTYQQRIDAEARRRAELHDQAVTEAMLRRAGMR